MVRKLYLLELVLAFRILDILFLTYKLYDIIFKSLFLKPMMVQLFEIGEILNPEQLPKIFVICVCAVSSCNEIIHVF